MTGRRGEEAAARDVLALLASDHRRIDILLARALGLLNQGNAAMATPLLHEFAGVLRRHVAFEDGALAASLGAGHAASDQPVAIMLREHREIAQQLALIDELLAQASPDASELGVYCAILSGTLAKHEHREEQNLFPLWRVALSRRSAEERERLLAQARALIGS